MEGSSAAKTCASSYASAQSVRLRHLELDALEHELIPCFEAPRSITFHAPQDSAPGYRTGTFRADPERPQPTDDELCFWITARSTERLEGGGEEVRIHAGQLSNTDSDLSNGRGPASTRLGSNLVEEILYKRVLVHRQSSGKRGLRFVKKASRPSLNSGPSALRTRFSSSWSRW